MSFATRTKVRFADVDPAGIVFYPRYFEMLNGAVEDWFADDLGADFASLHLGRGIGVPTVHIDCRFMKPGRLGDRLDLTIDLHRLGTSSLTFGFSALLEGEPRLQAVVVLVCMDLTTQRAVPWPDDLRLALERHLPPQAGIVG